MHILKECIYFETSIRIKRVNIMNTFTTEQAEAIMSLIMDGNSKEMAIAKMYQGVINNIGPSYSDATDAMKKEYKEAKEGLKNLGYYMEVGYLKKI